MQANIVTALTWHRISAGEYTATHGKHTFDVTHRIIPNTGNGYGRRDDWVLRHTGPDTGWNGEPTFDYDYAADPVPTYKEAKRYAETWLISASIPAAFIAST